MKITAFDIYLISQCDKLWALLLALSLLFSVGCAAAFFASLDTIETDGKLIPKWLVRLAPVVLSLWLLFCIMPDSKTAAAMMVVPKIVNSDIMQKDIPDAVKKLLQEYVDKTMERKR